MPDKRQLITKFLYGIYLSYLEALLLFDIAGKVWLWSLKSFDFKINSDGGWMDWLQSTLSSVLRLSNLGIPGGFSHQQQAGPEQCLASHGQRWPFHSLLSALEHSFNHAAALEICTEDSFNYQNENGEDVEYPPIEPGEALEGHSRIDVLMCLSNQRLIRALWMLAPRLQILITLLLCHTQPLVTGHPTGKQNWLLWSIKSNGTTCGRDRGPGFQGPSIAFGSNGHQNPSSSTGRCSFPNSRQERPWEQKHPVLSRGTASAFTARCSRRSFGRRNPS